MPLCPSQLAYSVMGAKDAPLVLVARVAPRWRAVEQEQGGQSGRLRLVRDVAVPDRGGQMVVVFELEVGLAVSVDEVELGPALGLPAHRVDMRPAKELAPIVDQPVLGLVDEFLVPEGLAVS